MFHVLKDIACTHEMLALMTLLALIACTHEQGGKYERKISVVFLSDNTNSRNE